MSAGLHARIGEPGMVRHIRYAPYADMRNRLLILLVLLGAPRVALACPVCFGQNDSPMAQAMNLGILLMLVVVAGVLASFAAFFISLVRRARLAEPVPGPSRVEPQEGTAQC